MSNNLETRSQLRYDKILIWRLLILQRQWRNNRSRRRAKDEGATFLKRRLAQER